MVRSRGRGIRPDPHDVARQHSRAGRPGPRLADGYRTFGARRQPGCGAHRARPPRQRTGVERVRRRAAFEEIAAMMVASGKVTRNAVRIALAWSLLAATVAAQRSGGRAAMPVPADPNESTVDVAPIRCWW